MNSIMIAKIIDLLPQQITQKVSKTIIYYLLKRYAQIQVEGLEQLEQCHTPTIFICNHLSNADGLILNQVLRKLDPTFVAGIKLSNNPVTQIGMNAIKTISIKPQSADIEGLKSMIKNIKQGENLVIFPEGTRSRVGSMIEAKKGIFVIAQMTGAPIVPIGLYGTKKLLPIDSNENMSTERFHKATVNVHIGKQFRLPKRSKEQDKKVYDAYVTQYAMEQISQLLPEIYRGVYALSSV